MIHGQLGHLQHIQKLTAEYASYTQRRSGLGNVLGGVAGLIVYFIGLFQGPGVLTATITIIATLLWLIGKEILRARLYQSFGTARETWAKDQRQLQIGLVIALSLIALWIVGMFVWSGRIFDPSRWAYVFFVAITPLIAWRFLRTQSEFIVGVFLLSACAVTSAGGAYDLGGAGLLFLFVPIAAVVLIVLGVKEHQHFLKLRSELSQLEGRDDGNEG